MSFEPARAIRSSARARPGAVLWLWAAAAALVALSSTNPLVHIAILISAALAVAELADPREPWSGSLRTLMTYGLVLIGARLLLLVVFTPRVPGDVAFRTPEVALPEWLSGLWLGGAVTWQALFFAAVESLRLLAIIAVFGAASSIVAPTALARSMPPAVHELGVALTIGLAVTPAALREAAVLRQALRLRGLSLTNPSNLRYVTTPLLERSLERSNTLAASMDSRGYGHTRARHWDRQGVTTGDSVASPAGEHPHANANDGPARTIVKADRPSVSRWRVSAVLWAAMLAAASAGYYALDRGVVDLLALLLVGAALLSVGLALRRAGRGVERTRYQRAVNAPLNRMVTVGSAILVLSLMGSRWLEPDAVNPDPTIPAWPPVPMVLLAGVMALPVALLVSGLGRLSRPSVAEGPGA